MSEPRHDLLHEALLGVTTATGASDILSLPGLLARLARGEELEPVALQAHQQHPWFAFLVQLAALALHQRGGDGPLPDEEQPWRELLLALTPGQPEAWSLLVPEVGRPAFFQPPVPEGAIAALKTELSGPADLDVLVTTRNHDVKSRRLTHARPEHWVYALVTVQTSDGFLGRGNYGVARMNGGFASRPGLGVAANDGWSTRFRRDVRLWLEQRASLVATYSYPASGGHRLLWLLPWDGKSSLSLQDCDPFFLEVCRRLRLTEAGAGLGARFAPTDCPRVEARMLRGLTGDAWTPVKKGDEPAALTVSEDGFTYRRIPQLLFGGDFIPSPATEVRREDGPTPIFFAQALVRGQGKTEGFHQRRLPIPPTISGKLGKPDVRAKLGNQAGRNVENVSKLVSKALRPALCALLQGGADKLNLKDDRVDPWLERFESKVDRVFFDELWRADELPAEEADVAWAKVIVALGEETLEQAIHAMPVSLARWHRAVASAEGRYRGGARKNFPDAFPPRGAQKEEHDEQPRTEAG